MASLSSLSLREPAAVAATSPLIAGLRHLPRGRALVGAQRSTLPNATPGGLGSTPLGSRRRGGVVVKGAGSSDRSGVTAEVTGPFDLPVLSASEVAQRLREHQQSKINQQTYLAMYSSIFGGITTDPEAMVIQIDDHLVHRGHGVFDTAAIVDGYLYELDQHLDRFLRSASMAKIALPFDSSAIRSILIQTVSTSKCMQGSLRYWLSPGPGDFLLSPSGCPNPALYAVVIGGHSLPVFKGVKVITSSIPMKPQQFAVMKNVNYLPNVLSKMEAEENGAFAGIWLDDEGFVAEGPNMNVAFVTARRELLMPHFDKILSGCTEKRVSVLAKNLVADGKLNGIRFGNVTVEDGKAAQEMMLIGSGILVKPVLQWDDQLIGTGGFLTLAIYDDITEKVKMIIHDMLVYEGGVALGGVALTAGLVAAVAERVLHSIPSNEAIDTVEVLQSRIDPSFVAWKGGASQFVGRPSLLQQAIEEKNQPMITWGLLTYTEDTMPLAETDLDIMNKKSCTTTNEEVLNERRTVAGKMDLEGSVDELIVEDQTEGTTSKVESVCSSVSKSPKLALKLGFTLPASCYATMAIRELLKTSTSVLKVLWHKRFLNLLLRT